MKTCIGSRGRLGKCFNACIKPLISKGMIRHGINLRSNNLLIRYIHNLVIRNTAFFAIKVNTIYS